jgi:hypothetical protein
VRYFAGALAVVLAAGGLVGYLRWTSARRVCEETEI